MFPNPWPLIVALCAFLAIPIPAWVHIQNAVFFGQNVTAAGSGFALAGQDQAENQSTTVTSIQSANGVTTTTGWGAIVYCIGDYPTGSLNTVTDSQGDGFTVSSDQVVGAGGNVLMQTAYATSITGHAANKVTCNFNGNTHSNTGVKVLYFSRTSGSWAHAVAEGSSTTVSGTTGSLGANTITTTTPIVGVSCINNGSFGAATFSAGSIGGNTATLGTTTLGSNTGIVGCQYAAISGNISGGDATESLSSSQTIATIFDSLK